ncbi:type IV pilus inner membrane component PilO [Methylohalobius crimeensis]|uniref:type 4a pilus biogenesis protein PilO n=1 Tax=Methylohalobius crimeensis TaxID=244365 RepID=UPI0003B53E07|nr:type 4a pilus biogenesis protein PilO [Methylohalobius crimeensis]
MTPLSEVDWDLESAGTWPLPVKIAVMVIIAAVVAGLWIYFDTQDQLAQLDKVRQEEKNLKDTFASKQKKAIHLEEYKQQLAEMEKTFGDMLRQLPNKAEVPDLLVDVSQTGLAAGLEFELFQPQAENKKDFYAELPIRVRVTGDYDQLGAFVSGLASLPRIVTVHDVALAPVKDNARMVMNAVIKTYRYLDEEEIGGRSSSKRGGKRGRR